MKPADRGLHHRRKEPTACHQIDTRPDYALLQSDIANVHQRLDHQGDRLDRIERRLEIAEAPA